MTIQAQEAIAENTLSTLKASLDKLTKAATGKPSDIKVEDLRGSHGGFIHAEAVTISKVPPEVENLIREFAWQAGISIPEHNASNSEVKFLPLTFTAPKAGLAPEDAAQHTPDAKLQLLNTLVDDAARTPTIRARLAVEAYNAATAELPPDEQIAAFGAFVQGANLPSAVKQQVMRANAGSRDLAPGGRGA